MSSMRKRKWYGFVATFIITFALMSILGVGKCELKKETKTEAPGIALPPGQAVIYSVEEKFPLRSGPGSLSRIILADPKGTSAEVLLKGKGVISRLSPSPDGKYIAFTFKRVGPGSSQEGYERSEGRLWLLSIGDGRMTHISALDAKAGLVSKPPSFSSDGKVLAFSSEDGSVSRIVKLFIYDIAKGELTTPGCLSQLSLDDNAPHFLLGDKEIACNIKYLEGPSFTDTKYRMIAVDYAADTYRVITDFEKEDRVGVPLPGPDGKYIYYNYSKLVNHLEVRRIPIEGGEPEKVFDEKYVLYLVDFIPEREKTLMSYHIQEFNRHYVCIGDLKTGRTQIITGDVEDFSIFSGTASETGLKYVSPDGKLILTYFHDLQYDFRDILVMDIEGGNRVNISNTALFDEDIATWIVIPVGVKIPVGGYEIE